MNQRGFIALPIMGWAAVAAGAVILALGVAVKVQTSRLDSCKEASAAFQATVKAEGEAAAKEAARVNQINLKAWEKANAKIKALSADNAVLLKRLRRDNPPESRLPSAPADTKRPDLLCLDREQYQREDGIALANLFAGARSLADEGTAYSLRLSTAAEWAASLAK